MVRVRWKSRGARNVVVGEGEKAALRGVLLGPAMMEEPEARVSSQARRVLGVGLVSGWGEFGVGVGLVWVGVGFGVLSLSRPALFDPVLAFPALFSPCPIPSRHLSCSVLFCHMLYSLLPSTILYLYLVCYGLIRSRSCCFLAPLSTPSSPLLPLRSPHPSVPPAGGFDRQDGEGGLASTVAGAIPIPRDLARIRRLRSATDGSLRHQRGRLHVVSVLCRLRTRKKLSRTKETIPSSVQICPCASYPTTRMSVLYVCPFMSQIYPHCSVLMVCVHFKMRFESGKGHSAVHRAIA